MARLVTSGFEWNDTASLVEGESSVTGGSTIVTSPVRSGGFALNGRFIWSFGPGTLGVTYFGRDYIYWDGTLPGARTVVLQLDDTVTTDACITMETDGTLQLRFGGGVGTGGTTQVGSAATIPANTWLRLEVSCVIGTGAIDAIEGRIDGAAFASGSSLTISDGPPGTFRAGSPPGAGSSCDDVALNDSSGANQNTFPGSGKVVLLRPASDNAGGTGWTLGTGTALGGNGFAAEDNAPPVGVADLAVGSDPKQIRNATANANVNYDANLTTYLAAGITSLDVVNVVVPVVVTAAPVTTSAKQGTFGIVSNPTIANVALGAGGTAGAFWSGTAAGTFPTGWKISFGTITYAPAVVVSTAPVMRVTQVTSSTRIAMVCGMGLYVDFTPHSTPANSIKGAQTPGHARVPSLYGPPM